MNSYKLKISTPDGNVFEDEVVKFDVRGLEGDLAVMAGHIPFMTALKPCDCKIMLPDGDERIGSVAGGLLSVGDDVVLLTGGFKWKE